jgi:phage-related protein
MANGYDGSIRINTKIDTDGAQTGIAKLSSTLKKLGSLIATVFAVKIIKSFVTECASAYKTQMLSEQKITAELRNRYNATQDVIQSVYDLASAEQAAGVIGDEVQLNGLASLSAYVDNLEDLKSLTSGMNDILAYNYGFDATAENASSVATAIGKAIKDGTTRSLESLGVAIDDDTEKLLENATAAERVEIINNAIAKSVGGINEKLAQTPYGQIQQLKNSFGDLKEVVGQAAINVGSLFVPALQKAVTWATALANKLVMVSNAMRQVFGVSTANGNIADTATDAAEAQESVATAIEDTGKAIAGNLAGFDEITTMQSATSDSDTDASSVSSALKDDNTDETTEEYNKIVEVLTRLKAFLDQIVTVATKLGELILPILEKAAERLKTKFNILTKAITQIVQAFADSDDAGEAFEKVVDTIVELIGDLTDDLTTNIDAFVGIAERLITSLCKGINKALPKLLAAATQIVDTILNSIIDNLPKLIECAIQIIETLVQTILENLPQIIVAGEQVIEKLINGVVSMLPDIVTMVISLIKTVVQTIMDNLPQIIDASVQCIISFVNCLLDNAPEIVDAVVEIIYAIIEIILENLPQLIECGFELIIKLQEGFIKATPKLLSAVAEIIKKLWDKFWNTDWISLGKNILTGIGNGITNAVTSTVNTVKNACSSIWDSIKNFFGIHSPSTLMRDTVGNNIALGIGEGFAGEISDVSDDMTGALGEAFNTDEMAEQIAPDSDIYTSIENGYETMFTNLKSMFTDFMLYVTQTVDNAVALVQSATDGAGASIANITKSLSALKAESVIKVATSVDYTPTSVTTSVDSNARGNNTEILDKLDEVVEAVKAVDDGGDIVIQVVDKSGNVTSQKTIEDAKRQNRIAGKTIIPVGG